MPLLWEPYLTQLARWPAAGRRILAQFDAGSIWVYQAYRPDIAAEAVEAGRFGPLFSRSRMSWIKPNFLWMMYRSGWATREGQERVLALRLRRAFFDEILAQAVHSSHQPSVHADRAEWSQAIARSPVRLQWDPDHGPGGQPVERRAVQLGLRGEVLARDADRELLEVVDLTAAVHAQHEALRRGVSFLHTPHEEVYPVADPAVAARLRLDP